MVPGRDRTRDPWICSRTRICSQTRYRLRYAARYKKGYPTKDNLNNVKVFRAKARRTKNYQNPSLGDLTFQK